MPTKRIFRRHFYWIVETLLPNTQGLTTFISMRCPTELDLPAGLHAHQRLITSPRRSEKWNSFHDKWPASPAFFQPHCRTGRRHRAEQLGLEGRARVVVDPSMG